MVSSLLTYVVSVRVISSHSSPSWKHLAKVSQKRLLSASTPQQVSRSPVCRKRVKDTSGSLLACLPTQLKLDHSQSVLRLEDFSQTCVSESMSVYDINEYIKSCINIESSGVFDKHVAVEAKCIQINSQ